MAVDVLLSRSPGARGREAGDAWVAEAVVGGQEVLLVKPLTFMNRSGEAVARLLQATGSAHSELVVLVDDVALDLGVLRVRERGSHGGHNGLRSLIETLETEEFARVRIGVGRGDPAPGDDIADYVLSDFRPEEVLVVQEVVGAAADAVECLWREGAAAAMNRFNVRPQP
jgi:PTH1 family peptidyl-tRNA hydrolase